MQPRLEDEQAPPLWRFHFRLGRPLVHNACKGDRNAVYGMSPSLPQKTRRDEEQDLSTPTESADVYDRQHRCISGLVLTSESCYGSSRNGTILIG